MAIGSYVVGTCRQEGEYIAEILLPLFLGNSVLFLLIKTLSLFSGCLIFLGELGLTFLKYEGEGQAH